ncbi:unnamed protein product, partial [Mesorhabditis spiculigera]
MDLDAELALFEAELSTLPEPDEAGPSRPAKAPRTTITSDGAHIVAAPSVFKPPQLRVASVAPAKTQPLPNSGANMPGATIESGPALIRTPNVPYVPSEAPKLSALPSDIDAINRKRDKERREAMMSRPVGKKFVRTAGGQVWEDSSLADWDPNDFRIFCGDLGNEVSDELLAKAFRKYPSFLKAKVVRDGRSNKSKGFGFVSFKSQEDYVRAMREMDGKYVGNRPIKLRKSNWQERQIDVVKKKQTTKKKLGLMY